VGHLFFFSYLKTFLFLLANRTLFFFFIKLLLLIKYLTDYSATAKHAGVNLADNKSAGGERVPWNTRSRGSCQVPAAAYASKGSSL